MRTALPTILIFSRRPDLFPHARRVRSNTNTQHKTMNTPIEDGRLKAPALPWPRAADASTYNPTVQQRRVSELVKASADTLQRIGLQNRMRVCHMEHSTGETA